MKVEYRKGDVWLCEHGYDNVPLTILEMAGGYVRHIVAGIRQRSGTVWPRPSWAQGFTSSESRSG